MKFKLIAALLGLTMAIPGAVIAQSSAQNPAQNQDDQAPDQNAKPSPYIQAPVQAPAPGPNDQGPADQNSAGQNSMDQNSMDQDSRNQDSMDNGSMNQGPAVGPNDTGSGSPGAGAPTASTPAPVENNGVARISLIHGDVSTQRGDSKDWSAAALNAPLVAGDRVSTGDKARTELELDYANTLRLAEHTQANITQLTRSQIQIQLGHGMANYTVYKGSDADARCV